jgi:hypothetical protein
LLPQLTSVVLVSLVPVRSGRGRLPTFGHDPQRTGWASSERTVTAANVSSLELKWKTKLDNQAFQLASLTALS